MTNTTINLLDLNREEMQAFFLSIGEKSFRAEQVFKWIHQLMVDDFEKMTNLSKSLREKLAAHAEIRAPEINVEQFSKDGTAKWLMHLPDGNAIETVFIPEESRGTLCVSSQVGCALNCQFCSTGQQGFNRNLSTSEIIGQVWQAKRRLQEKLQTDERIITNVVMMGMGEPLLNYTNVVSAMNTMMDDFAYGLSKRRVTLSTSGIIPAMRQLSQDSDVALAVSLHAPNDTLRDELVPINKKYPLKDLMAVCRDYFKDDNRRVITMEYVMLDRVNDLPEHAEQLIDLLYDIPCKINLIPFNPFPNTRYKRSAQHRINAFRDRLVAAGFNTITRRTRGDDIDAACGQLVGEVTDRTRRTQQRVINIQAVNS